jgi:hypothetical protein
MKKRDYLPQDYNRIKVVDQLEDVFIPDFVREKINCVLLPRDVRGDFNGLAALLFKNHYSGTKGFLRRLHNTLANEMHVVLRDKDEIAHNLMQIRDTKWIAEDIRDAASTVFNDVAAIGHYRDYPQLRILKGRSWQNSDIYDFHDDAFAGAHGRTMCCYLATTEFLANEDASERGKNVLPKKYRINAGATSHRFRSGDIWRQGTRHLGGDPFIHRAPKLAKGEYRLNLVMD